MKSAPNPERFFFNLNICYALISRCCLSAQSKYNAGMPDAAGAVEMLNAAIGQQCYNFQVKVEAAFYYAKYFANICPE